MKYIPGMGFDKYSVHPNVMFIYDRVIRIHFYFFHCCKMGYLDSGHLCLKKGLF